MSASQNSIVTYIRYEIGRWPGWLLFSHSIKNHKHSNDHWSVPQYILTPWCLVMLSDNDRKDCDSQYEDRVVVYILFSYFNCTYYPLWNIKHHNRSDNHICTLFVLTLEIDNYWGNTYLGQLVLLYIIPTLIYESRDAKNDKLNFWQFWNSNAAAKRFN